MQVSLTFFEKHQLFHLQYDPLIHQCNLNNMCELFVGKMFQDVGVKVQVQYVPELCRQRLHRTNVNVIKHFSLHR